LVAAATGVPSIPVRAARCAATTNAARVTIPAPQLTGMGAQMQIFLDTANLDEIKQGVALGLVDGVTTNPSLVAKEQKPGAPVKFKQRVIEICELVHGPVSAEVTAVDYDGIMAQAHDIAQWHEHVVVKVPLIEDGLRAIKTLS